MPYLMWRLHPLDIRIVVYNVIGAVLFIICVSRNAFIQRNTAKNNYKNNITLRNTESANQQYRSLSGQSNLFQNALYTAISNIHIQPIYQLISIQPGINKNNMGTVSTPGDMKQFSEKPAIQGPGKQQRINSILNNASK